MGNSDSKPTKQGGTPSPSHHGTNPNAIRGIIEREFLKRSQQSPGYISRDGFQSCLRTIQTELDLFAIAKSPLGLGLFEMYAKERPNGQAVISAVEYAAAISILFDGVDIATQTRLTAQCILDWYSLTHTSSQAPTAVTDDMVIAFYEATWKFAWSELRMMLLSNACLNGKDESEAILRFSESNLKHFNANCTTGWVLTCPPTDRTISVRIGDDVVHVPTSFSFTSNRGISGLQLRSRPAVPAVAYPEL